MRLELSQSRTADLAGVSRKWLSEFEGGKPTTELVLVLRLLDALNLTMSVGTEKSPTAAGPTDTEVINLNDLLESYRRP